MEGGGGREGYNGSMSIHRFCFVLFFWGECGARGGGDSEKEIKTTRVRDGCGGNHGVRCDRRLENEIYPTNDKKTTNNSRSWRNRGRIN